MNYLTEDRRRILAKILAGIFLAVAVLAASAGTGAAIAQRGADDAPGTEIEHGVENEVENEVEAIARKGADDAPGGEAEFENEIEHGVEVEFEAVG